MTAQMTNAMVEAMTVHGAELARGMKMEVYRTGIEEGRLLREWQAAESEGRGADADELHAAWQVAAETHAAVARMHAAIA